MSYAPQSFYGQGTQTTSPAMMAAAQAAQASVMLDAQKDARVEQSRMDRAMGFRSPGGTSYGVQSPGGSYYANRSPGGSYLQRYVPTAQVGHPFQSTQMGMSPTGYRSPGGRWYEGSRSPSGVWRGRSTGYMSPGGRSYSAGFALSRSPGGRSPYASPGMRSPGGTQYGFRSPGGSYWTAGPEMVNRRKYVFPTNALNPVGMTPMGLPSVGGGFALPQTQSVRSPVRGGSFVLPPTLYS